VEEPRAWTSALPRLRMGVLAASVAVVGAIAFLLARLAPDVHEKPLFEDEAVTGLIAPQPLGELIHTVMWERGGGPLHFLLGHLTLAIDPSPFALRWLSVLFALATVPLCYDLGRRVSGRVAGIAAAVVAATSTMLAVYGSFGRMYALYAFASALAIDLFVRAVQQPSGRTAFAAAAAAWLLPAIHPFGALLVGAEALVALVLWRGRPLLPALPVAAVGLAMVPFAIADLRLAGRFEVGLDGETRIAAPHDAFDQALRAVAASAGGAGWTFGLLCGFALAGLIILVRREPAFAGLAALAFAVPPLLLAYAKTGSEPGLSPRHLIFLLPITAALIGAGLAYGVRTFSPSWGALAVAALAAVVLVAPAGGITDPRDWSNDVLGGGPPERALGGESALAQPSRWLRASVGPNDVLFPYSAVYLSGLPATGEATALPYSQTALLLRSLERVPSPVGDIFVSVPIGDASLDRSVLAAQLGPQYSYERFDRWLLVRVAGPFQGTRAVLLPIYTSLVASRDAVGGDVHDELAWYFKVSLSVICGSLRAQGDVCPADLKGRS
jgi:Dolichyl-phosphate-mannose-protein mannosyltransferase